MFLVALWLVVFLTRGWLFWVLVLVSAVISWFVIGRYLYRNASPWRRIYFPLIDHYAFVSGAHIHFADATGEAFSPINPMRAVLKAGWPNASDEETDGVLSEFKRRFDEFDRPFFAELVHEVLPNDDIESRLDLLRQEMFGNNYNAMLVRYIIGEIIALQAGIDQKKKFWKAVLTNRIA